MNTPLTKIIAFIIFGFIFLTVASSSVTVVPVGYRGIPVRFGAPTGEVRDEGMHIHFPFIDKIVLMEVRVQKEEASASAASKDLQSVSSVVALNFHVDPAQVVGVYRNLGQEYKTRIIVPALQESVKAATAKFTAEELITKREIVRDEIKISVQAKLQNDGIIVDDFNVVNFEFSESFNQAIEAKVTAEQQALAAKNRLEQIKYEAEQDIARAKGKAEAQRIEGEALRANPEVLQLRAIEQWDGKLPQYLSGSEQLPFILRN